MWMLSGWAMHGSSLPAFAFRTGNKAAQMILKFGPWRVCEWSL